MEVRVLRDERARRSRAPTSGVTQCCPYLITLLVTKVP